MCYWYIKVFVNQILTSTSNPAKKQIYWSNLEYSCGVCARPCVREAPKVDVWVDVDEERAVLWLDPVPSERLLEISTSTKMGTRNQMPSKNKRVKEP